MTAYKINTDKNKKYKHEKLTGLILKAAFEIHNTLGCGFLEKVYEKALIYELKTKGLKLETQKAIIITYKNQNVGTYMADIIVDDKKIASR